MRQFTLMRIMIAGLALPLLAAAQVPPTPPAKPAPTRRAKPALPPVEPMEPMEPMIAAPMIEPVMPMDFEFKLNMDQLSQQLQELQIDQLPQLAQLPQIAQDVELKMRELDMDRLAVHAQDMQLKGQMLAERVMADLPHALMIGDMNPKTFADADRLLNSVPRKSWSRQDPADSLYRAAREALNRGEYRRAAQLFNEITKKFKNSDYAEDCAYWEAFARYRLGGTDELKQALKILEGKGEVQIHMVSSRESGVDVPALRARVQGALAARGDADAVKALQTEARQGGASCDREEVSVRAEALGALGQMDMQAAMPTVRKVLARRDECTVELRRRALYLLGRQSDPESATLILDVAKNDSDPGIRGEAMRWLPRVAGDNAVPQLEELLRTSTDEQAQRSAIAALGAIDSDRARRAVHAIIERRDVSERIRYDAIISLSREREGRSFSSDEMAYLRSLYAKLDSPKLREAVLTSVGRIETPENTQFLLSIARNQNESASLRTAAMQRLGRMSTVTLDDVAKLYDVADARSLREQVLYALYQRKEPEAVDKMMDIARKDTDPQIRRTAISLLARRNDPRAKELIARLIEP